MVLNTRSSSGVFGIPFRLVGFGFWQAWWMLAMCTDLLLPQRSESGTLFNSFFCITVLTTLGYLAAVGAGRRFGSFGAYRGSCAVAGGLAAAGSLGLFGFKTFFYAGAVAPGFFVGAVPFAVGNALLLIMWGELWSTLATGRVGRSLYASYAFAFVVYFVVVALPSVVAGVVACLLPVVAAAALWACRGEPKRKPSQIDFEIESVSVVRVAVAVVVIGAVHGFVQRFLNVSGIATSATLSSSLVVAGVGMVLLVLYLVLKQPAVEVLSLYTPIVPLFVVGLVLLAVLPSGEAFMGNGLVLLAVYSTDMLVMIASTDIAFRMRRPVALCFGLALFGMRFGTTLASGAVYGLMMTGWLDGATSSVAYLAGVVVVVLVGSVVFTPVDLAKLYKARPLEESGSGAADRCAALAQQCGLTPRETEVLTLLAEGRSAPYIAGELCIAESSTKHHISSIYRKIGVCDRQSLMDVIVRGAAGKGALPAKG